MRIQLKNHGKKETYDGNKIIISLRLIFKCGNKFWKIWMHLLDVIDINLFNPGTCQVYKTNNRSTYGSSLGNAAHMAAFRSKKAPMEHGIHCATSRKDSAASEILA